jgi:hypothetical protein
MVVLLLLMMDDSTGRGNWPHPQLLNVGVAARGRGNGVWGIAHSVGLRIDVLLLLLL